MQLSDARVQQETSRPQGVQVCGLLHPMQNVALHGGCYATGS